MDTGKLVINTNLASLLVQRNSKTSSDKLGQAIERLSTGAKINHASDNAANFGIATNLNTKINSYQIAEENASEGLNMLETTTSSLDLIENRLQRLRMLQEQAMNETYGQQSLEAINLECNSIIDEIERTYSSTDYNGINLLQTKYSYEEIFANEDTTFDLLGIGESHFEIYDSSNNLVEAYDTDSDDNIGNFLGALRTHGFTADIVDGKITLESPDYYYVTGDLAERLGISSSSINVISSVVQNSTNAGTYTMQSLATGDATFKDIGILESGTANINVRNADGTYAGNIAINSGMSLNTFFSRLTGYDITGEISDGVITLNSSVGNYLETGGIVSKLGIGVQVDSVTTTGKSQTSTLPIIRTETITTPETTETIWTTTTTGSTYTETIWTTTTSTTTSTETIWTTTTSTTTSTETIWTTTTTSSTSTEEIYTTDTIETTVTVTVGTSQTSCAAIYVTTTVTQTYTITEALSTTMANLEAFASDAETIISRVESGGLVSVITQKNSAPSGYTWVTTADELQTALTNNQNICLGADIDMSLLSSDWVMKTNYSKTFDGNGHTISNFSITSSASEVGLIASTSFGAVIKNVRMENVDITSTANNANVGGLVGQVALLNTIDNNVIVSGTISSTGSSSYAGGIAGCSMSIINCCYNSSSIICGGNVVAGGIVGGCSKTITNCYNLGDVNGSYTGGICGGYLFSCSSITNCYNSGNIGGSFAGGIIGYNDCTITNCYNSGSVTSSSYAGGILGYGKASASASIINCYNIGSINGTGTTSSAGELLGSNTNSSSIINCYNSGSINARWSGGIIGHVNNRNTCIINSYNSGTISATDNGSYSGGITGYASSDSLSITNCYNSGTISATGSNSACGGIVGNCNSNIWITNCVNSSSNTDYGIKGKGSATVTNSYYNNSLRNGGGTATSESDALNRINQGINISSQTVTVSSSTTSSTCTESTTLGQLGISSPVRITYHDSDGNHSETFSTSTTLSQIMDWLGLTTSLSDGKITLIGGDDLYISSFDSTLMSKLNLTNNWSTLDERVGSTTTITTTTTTTTLWTTTTTSATNTIETTTTTTVATTNTIETTTTTTLSTTNTIDTTTTTTTSTTNTIPATSVTNTITLTSSSTLGDFGLSGNNYITIHVGGTDQIVTVKASDTVAQLISNLGGVNSITASVTDGKISLTPDNPNVYIKGVSSGLQSFLNIGNNYYDTKNNYANTDSRTCKTSSTHTIVGTTSLSDAGLNNSDIKVHNSDGSVSRISLAGLVDFNDLIEALRTNGLEMTLTDGITQITGLGNTYLESSRSNLAGILKLGDIINNYVSQNVNNVKGITSYFEAYENDNYAPEEIVLQIGIHANENSQLRVKTQLETETLHSMRRIGLDKETDFLSRIDSLLKTVNQKQVEIGSAQIRLMSAVEEINCAYENLVSTRSTICDADIAEVSGEYLRNQILQQAAATLLATANQTPSIALGLL